MEFWINLSCFIFIVVCITIAVILKKQGERIIDFLWAAFILFGGLLSFLNFIRGKCPLTLEIIFWMIAILILCLALVAIVFLILSFIYSKKKDEKKEHKSIKIFYLSLIIAVLLNIILQILGIFIK